MVCGFFEPHTVRVIELYITKYALPIAGQRLLTGTVKDHAPRASPAASMSAVVIYPPFTLTVLVLSSSIPVLIDSVPFTVTFTPRDTTPFTLGVTYHHVIECNGRCSTQRLVPGRAIKIGHVVSRGIGSIYNKVTLEI